MKVFSASDSDGKKCRRTGKGTMKRIKHIHESKKAKQVNITASLWGTGPGFPSERRKQKGNDWILKIMSHLSE